MPLKPNLKFWKKKPTEEAKDALFRMYEKNNKIKDLVKVFDLDINAVEVPPHDQQERDKLIVNKNKSQMAKTSKKEFKNEVEESKGFSFINIEEGKPFTGKFYGESRMFKDDKDGKEKESFIVENEEDGEMYQLPTAFKLVSKMKNLKQITSKEDLALGIDVQISNEGKQKVEGVKNEMRIYKVLTT